jgi:hypothetical protein
MAEGNIGSILIMTAEEPFKHNVAGIITERGMPCD